jgi:hypothetical protein
MNFYFFLTTKNIFVTTQPIIILIFKYLWTWKRSTVRMELGKQKRIILCMLLDIYMVISSTSFLFPSGILFKPLITSSDTTPCMMPTKVFPSTALKNSTEWSI